MLELQLAHVPVRYTSLLNTPCLVVFRLDKTCVAKVIIRLLAKKGEPSVRWELMVRMFSTVFVNQSCLFL